MAAAAERAKAEARKGEAPAGDTVDLAGHPLSVLPTADWRASAIRALADNNFDVWAQGCLSRESYAVWREVDPTLRQCEQFFADWKNRTGQDPGESSAS